MTPRHARIRDEYFGVTMNGVNSSDAHTRMALVEGDGPEPCDPERVDAEEWEPHFDATSFDLTETGVHFFGHDYPHVMAALDGQGPVIGYDVLLRDGYLRADSPVKRAWSGVAAAPKGKDWCPAQTWSTWWR